MSKDEIPSILLMRDGELEEQLEGIRSEKCRVEWTSELFGYIGMRIPADEVEPEVERLKSLGTIGAIVRERIGGEQKSSVEDPETLDIEPLFDHSDAMTEVYSQLSEVPPFSFHNVEDVDDGTDGSDIRAAIIDSGIHSGNPAVGEIEGRYNFTDEEELDVVGHGTAVAAIMRKSAPGSTIYDMKAVSKNQLREAHVIQALEACVEVGVHLVSLSLGFTPRPEKQWMCPTCSAVNRMSSAGMYITAAAGNHGTPVNPSPPVLCPAKAAGAIAVGATDESMNQRPYSPEGDLNIPDEWDADF